MSEMTIAVRQCLVQETGLDGFFRWLKETGKKELTIRAYRQALMVFSDWFEETNREAFSVELLNRFDLQSFREWELRTRRSAAATWNARRAALATLCTWARENGLIPADYDPLNGVKPASEEKPAPRWLNKTDARRLMRYMDQAVNTANTPMRKVRAIRDAAIVAIMRYAGLRVSELVNLELGDVELGERKGRVLVRLGKRDKSRAVPIGNEARTWLQRWLEVRPSCQTAALFVSDEGEALLTRAVQKRLEKISETTGIEDLTPHALRHTCAKRMLDSKRPLTEVQKILGHERLETTARYCQPGWEDLERAVEAGELE